MMVSHLALANLSVLCGVSAVAVMTLLLYRHIANFVNVSPSLGALFRFFERKKPMDMRFLRFLTCQLPLEQKRGCS